MPTFKLTLQRELTLSISCEDSDLADYLEDADNDIHDAFIAFLEDNETLLSDAIDADLSSHDFSIEIEAEKKQK